MKKNMVLKLDKKEMKAIDLPKLLLITLLVLIFLNYIKKVDNIIFEIDFGLER